MIALSLRKTRAQALQGDRFAADGFLAEAERQGWLTPPLLSKSELPPRVPVATWGEISAELNADREDR